MSKNRTEWYNQQDQLHRENGPAVELANGYKYWYLNGKEYSETDFQAEVKSHNNSCDGKIVEIG